MISYKKGVTSEGLSYELLDKLEQLDLDITITSAKRYDNSTSSHNLGLAVDIRVDDSGYRFKLIKKAIELGFTRIGIYDKHIHLDIDIDKPQGRSWVGKSR